MGTRITSTFRNIISIVATIALVIGTKPQLALAVGACGTGSWTPGNLEIHHINIGQGDSALIVGPGGKSLLFDAGESNWNASSKAQVIGPYVQGVLGCKSLDYVVISHFHLDHAGYVGYGGLWNLVETQGFTVGKTLVRDYNSYVGDVSGTFTNWKTYLEGAGQAKLHPEIATEGISQVDMGAGVTFHIVAVDGNGMLDAGDFQTDSNPPSENDYSIGAVISYGNFDEWMGGDMDGEYQTSGFGYSYHDIELSAASEIGDVDVYKANHHGSSHSSNVTFIGQLDPEVSIVTVGNGNTYGHPAPSTMNRLLATSTVYLTERGDTNTNIGSAIVAGNIVIKTSNGSTYTVNGNTFTATEPIRSDTDGDGYFAEADPDNNNSSLVPAPNGGCDPDYQTCSGSVSASVACQISPGQVVINEVLPAPSSNGIEWVELYNSTSSTLDIGNCIVDDIPGASPAYQIPASTFIAPHGFWTVDQVSYFNNSGDSVRFLKENGTTLLDSFSYGSTGYNVSWYRLPDGGSWAGSPTSSTTKGQSNTLAFYPIVLSSNRLDTNPTTATSVRFSVAFSKPVTGVNTSPPFNDFALYAPGVSGASITGVSGSGANYTVTVNTGLGSGSLRLDVSDNDSIRDSANHPLGGAGAGNGSFTSGQVYSVTHQALISGNAGVAGATLTYTGGSTTADVSGNYSFTVSTGWSGTVTPSKPNYSFSPASRTYTNVMANQTAQNYAATQLTFAISGNTGAGGVTLSYVNGTPRTVISQPDGTYTFQVPRGWSGTVTPAKSGYIFAPVHRTYNNVLAAQNAQDYTAIPVYSISGNVGVAGVTLSYVDGDPKTVTSELNGNYSISLPAGWSGTVTPSHPCFTFTPIDQTYTDLGSNQTSQDYEPTIDLGEGCADIDIGIGGILRARFGLSAGASTRASFATVNSGPVRIASTNSVPLIAAERVIYKVNNVNTSFTEMLGLPDSQLDTTYWLPWYNNVDLDTQLRIANISGSTATVHVFIGGVEVTPGEGVSLTAGESTRLSYTSTNNGPVKLVSNVPIVASERLIYKINNINTSFSEMMALPNSQLDTTYWLPWYNNKDLDTQLRFANVTDQPAAVHVYIGGVEMQGSPFPLVAGESTRKSFPNINAGPVKIVSDKNIVAAERLIYKVNNVATSFTEMMALPNSALDTTYWLPWYNNKDLDTQLRFANVHETDTASVHVYIGGVEMPGSPFTLLPGESTRKSFADINSGPVQIVSNVPIVASERLIYKVNNVATSFSEMMALPNMQLDATYWLPWYNNVDLDTQLRFGVP
jgi:beta-lactamase superfamily II metal-dependent hydrolase